MVVLIRLVLGDRCGGSLGIWADGERIELEWDTMGLTGGKWTNGVVVCLGFGTRKSVGL